MNSLPIQSWDKPEYLRRKMAADTGNASEIEVSGSKELLRQLLSKVGPMRNGDPNYDEAISDVLAEIEALLDSAEDERQVTCDTRLREVQRAVADLAYRAKTASGGRRDATFFRFLDAGIWELESRFGLKITKEGAPYETTLYIDLPSPNHARISFRF